MTTPSAVETAEETTMDPPGRSSATVQASGHEPIAEPPEEEIAQPSAVETTMDPAGKSSATDQASGNEPMTPMTGASEGMVKPSKEELMALRSDLGKFLLAYDAHVNDDSDNFGYDRNAHSRFPRPWAVANELAKVFQHAYKIDVNADAWDEVFESEELRRTLKTVEDVEADMRESLPLSATRKNKLRRLLELQMYIRMVMTAQHQNFGWVVLEEAGQWSERDEITPMDRMTDDIRMLAQLALSYIIPQAEFSEWLEEVAVNGYGHSLQVQLSQHTFDNNAVLPVTMRGGNSGEPSFPRNSYRTPPRAKRGGNDCPSESHHQPTDGNDYPSQSYQTPRPSPRKRSKNVTHSNPSPKKKPNQKNRSKERERGTTTKQATRQGNGSKSAKRVSPNIANDGYEVGNPSLKKKSKRSQENRPSQDVRAYNIAAGETSGGSLKFLNKSSKIEPNGQNNRTCLPDAVVSLLPHELKISVHNKITYMMPSHGDTSIDIANKALAAFGMALVRDNKPYLREGGPAYNLLQVHDCKLILKIRLEDHEERVMNHFVAWDGKVIHDHPQCIRVNNSSDRKFKDSCTAVFRKLLPVKKFKKMQITNIYRLACLQGGCGEQGTAKWVCEEAGVVEEKVSALQLPKPPASDSSSADGVDNPPRDPVRHTSDLGQPVEKIKKGQLPKPPAPNSLNADGVDNPPRDPVCHTSVSGHALGGGNSDSKGNAGRRFRINGSKRRQARREKAAFRNPAGSE